MSDSKFNKTSDIEDVIDDINKKIRETLKKIEKKCKEMS